MSYDSELELVRGVKSGVEDEGGVGCGMEEKTSGEGDAVCSIGTSEKVRVLTMLSEASFMFTVTDIC